MKKLVLFLLVFSQLILCAQHQVDSLKAVLPEVTGDAKAEVLNNISLLLRQSDSTQSLGYAREALQLGEASQNLEIMAQAYANMAECLYYFDEFGKAQVNYIAALNLFKELDDLDRTGETYNALSLAHYYKGEYDWALENQIEAIKCLENSSDKHELAHVYSNMGMVYSRLSDYKMSISNYRKAASINRELKDDYSVAVNLNGIGVGYYNQGVVDSAKVNYSTALSMFKKLDDKRRVAIALNNLANIYVDEGDSLQKALDYYQEAIDVFDELKDYRNKTFVVEGLGCVYRAMNRYDKALAVFQEGLGYAKFYKLGYYIQQLYYKDIATTNELLGRTEQAYSAFKLYKVYQDSLHQEERIRQVAELEKRYESEKKEAEITKLNAENAIAELQIQKNNVIRHFGVVAILLLLVIIIYISFGYYQKRRTNILLSQKNSQIEIQKDELEKLNASKNKFFSIIAHDLKNPFHTVMGYSYLLDREYERFSETERKKYAGDIYRSTNTIFRLLQNLLDWSRSQTGRLKYEPVKFDIKYLYENIYNLLKTVADQKKIELESNVEDDIFVMADPMMVETILRNLINNAIKFSYEGGTVKTEIRVDEKEVIICVKDSGIGMSEDDLRNLFRIDSKTKRKGTNNEDGSGLGLILCKEFTTINKGTISAQSKKGQGSTFCFTIPLANSEA